MSGYLRSLVTQAAMPGPRLRPIAVPFARAPRVPVDVQPLDSGLEAAPSLAPAPPAVAAPSSPPSRVTTAPIDVVVPETREAITAPQPPMTLPEAVKWLTASPAPPVRDARRIERQAAANSDVLAAADRTQAGPIDRLPLVSPGADTLYRHNDTAETTPATRSRAEAAIVRSAPAPASSPLRAAHPRGAANRRPPDTSPDVHIHIGRIELTAVAEPAAPPRRRAAEKPAMPLEEYLQRRNGRSR